MQEFVKEIMLRLEFYRIVASVKFSPVQFSSIFAFFLFGRSTFGFYILVLVPASDTPNTYTHSHIINIPDLIRETIRVDIEIEIEMVISGGIHVTKISVKFTEKKQLRNKISVSACTSVSFLFEPSPLY